MDLCATYVVSATNTGRGPAVSAILQATNPCGAVQTKRQLLVRFLSDRRQVKLPPSRCGEHCSRTFTGAGALLTFNDFVGQALTASAAAHFRFPDVAPPTVDISLSASILWPPDHKFVDVIATIIAKCQSPVTSVKRGPRSR
jgi:hypothetical protein